MNPKDDELVEIDLGKLLFFYLKNWVAILVSGLACALAALLVTFVFMTPQYQAGVTVYVNNIKSTQGIEAITGTNLNAAQQLVNTYVNIIKSDTVLEEVIKQGQLNDTAETIRKIMSASQIAGTEMFTVTISHPDAEMAAHIANTIAEVAPKRISGFVKGSSTEIIDYAKVPTAPFTPNYFKNIGAGGIIGVVIMAAILTFQFLFDMRIKTEEDVASYLQVPVLGIIPAYETEQTPRNHRTTGAEGGY